MKEIDFVTAKTKNHYWVWFLIVQLGIIQDKAKKYKVSEFFISLSPTRINIDLTGIETFFLTPYQATNFLLLNTQTNHDLNIANFKT